MEFLSDEEIFEFLKFRGSEVASAVGEFVSSGEKAARIPCENIKSMSSALRYYIKSRGLNVRVVTRGSSVVLMKPDVYEEARAEAYARKVISECVEREERVQFLMENGELGWHGGKWRGPMKAAVRE